jgi:hypothetical protein
MVSISIELTEAEAQLLGGLLRYIAGAGRFWHDGQWLAAKIRAALVAQGVPCV